MVKIFGERKKNDIHNYNNKKKNKILKGKPEIVLTLIMLKNFIIKTLIYFKLIIQFHLPFYAGTLILAFSDKFSFKKWQH